MERAEWLRRRYGAEIEWRPFDLHPEYPAEGIAREELDRRYGAGFREGLEQMFAAAGLPFTRELDRVPNSGKALSLAELARERGVYGPLHERLFAAYWAEGRDIGADDVLAAEAIAAGLDEAEVRAELAAPAHRDTVERETRRLLELGGGGVPAWAIDDRVLVPGAQPHEVFDRVLGQLGYAPGAGA